MSTPTQSPEVKEIAAALMKAQANLKPAHKDSTNPHFRSKYADLSAIWDAAKTVLAPNGLSVTQTFSNGTGGETVTIVTTLLHTSGQWISSALTLKPSKADPQGVGSAITYGRRYGLSAILGIVADDDDDGNAASGHSSHSNAPEPERHAPEVREAQTPRNAPETSSDWRSFPMPKFTKKTGTLGSIAEDDLRYWMDKYVPKPWPNPDSPIKPDDLAFRAALDAAKAELTADIPY